MSVQTTYKTQMDLPRPGSIHGSDYKTDTAICETAAGIGFGLAVSQGSDDRGVVLGGALAGFRGVSVRDVAVGVPPVGGTFDVYRQYGNMSILTRGFIYVTPAVAVAKGDPVHYNTSTGVFTNTGGIGPITGARWATTSDGSEPAQIELSGFNQ